jgi:hypothetical protein
MFPRVPDHVEDVFVQGGFPLVMKNNVVQVLAGLVHDCAKVFQAHKSFGSFGDPGSGVTKRAAQVTDVRGFHRDAHRKRADAAISLSEFLPHQNRVSDLRQAFIFDAS